jgi:hypothetical protein
VVYVHFESPGRPSLVLGPYRAVRFVGELLYVLDGAEPIYLASQLGDGWHTHGIALARPAKAITLLEIVEGVDGPLQGLVPAVEAPDGGKLNRQLAGVCDQAADTTCKELRNVRLADLAR